MTATIDAVALAQALIRCPSVTPADAGALDVLADALRGLGFACEQPRFCEPGTDAVENLYARIGNAPLNFCFAGHTDVVPPGDEAAWTRAPFAGRIADGRLWGRGAADMKGAIAAFVAASGRFLARRRSAFEGSISLLVTGDEEGPAINGTVKVLEWLRMRGETIDACLVGEPTNPRNLGEMMKIGRRGSLNAVLTVLGTQGHAAYPALADNPIPRLIAMLGAIDEAPLDTGTPHFPPSTVALTSVDVGNTATNVIPERARAAFNIRFNDSHTGASLERWLNERFAQIGGRYVLDVSVSGEAFLTAPGPLSEIVAAAVRAATGSEPECSTTGGTSDARFIKDHCPVVEFGLVGATMHQVDENVAVDDINALSEIYEGVLARFFPDEGT
ncbi:MAG: succinyl-diaminopimelate desuccinylase [Rhodospirillales bacterium]|nr:succinyl-diaminopimelate desuccinylase [Rhodospirillales bacterium]MDP6803849.1 succinyl-diaminopimelate desuccinylase [Rhodospirillales bacterium]